MRSVIVAFNGGLLDRAVHAFRLSVGPWMFDFGEAVLDAVFRANPLEDMDEGVFVAFAVGELDSVIGQNMRKGLGNLYYRALIKTHVPISAYQWR